jgi:tetratricopeptide (TPR) repeat protein
LKYCWRNWQPGDWLIVIDDVTNYRQQVNPYKPPESSQFKVLLTTREELGRPVEHLRLDKLQPEAALDLLTSLVGAERIQQESEIAEQLCRQGLDFLPLGLELVGRYLERDPDLSLKAMLSLLEKKRLRHRSVLEADATMTAKLGVADAFELSWERLDENAQQLGCLLSLFASADIPWDLVKLAYSNMPSSEDEEIDLDILEEARGDLVRFNLLQRTGEGTYRLHQLIREFLREKREQSAQVNDHKQGFVAAMVAVAKQVPDEPTRHQIQELALAIPHVAEVAEDKDKNLRDLLSDEDLVWPFVGLGRFYEGQGLYDKATPWFEQCLSVTQTRVSPDHPAMATSLNNLAALYQSKGLYSKAEPLHLQAWELKKRLVGEDHPDIAETLNNLAELYRSQGRYQDAEPLYQQALEVNKRILGEDHPHVAVTLNNLAMLYEAQGRYQDAEPLYQQALEVNKRTLGEAHLYVTASLNNLAMLYQAQRRYGEAETIYLQALELKQHLLGEDHPHVAQSLNNLATLYVSQGRYSEAEPLYVQAWELWQRFLGQEHPDVATSLNNLAALYASQGRYSEAQPLYVQAWQLWKRLLGEDHPHVASSLNNLASLYYSQERFSEAELLCVQALEIYQQRLGSDHPDTINCRKGLAMLRDRLNSTARDLPNFNQKAKKGNSKKKPKGFG